MTKCGTCFKHVYSFPLSMSRYWNGWFNFIFSLVAIYPHISIQIYNLNYWNFSIEFETDILLETLEPSFMNVTMSNLEIAREFIIHIFCMCQHFYLKFRLEKYINYHFFPRRTKSKILARIFNNQYSRT